MSRSILGLFFFITTVAYASQSEMITFVQSGEACDTSLNYEDCMSIGVQLGLVSTMETSRSTRPYGCYEEAGKMWFNIYPSSVHGCPHASSCFCVVEENTAASYSSSSSHQEETDMHADNDDKHHSNSAWWSSDDVEAVEYYSSSVIIDESSALHSSSSNDYGSSSVVDDINESIVDSFEDVSSSDTGTFVEETNSMGDSKYSVSDMAMINDDFDNSTDATIVNVKVYDFYLLITVVFIFIGVAVLLFHFDYRPKTKTKPAETSMTINEQKALEKMAKQLVLTLGTGSLHEIAELNSVDSVINQSEDIISIRTALALRESVIGTGEHYYSKRHSSESMNHGGFPIGTEISHSSVGPVIHPISCPKQRSFGSGSFELDECSDSIHNELPGSTFFDHFQDTVSERSYSVCDNDSTDDIVGLFPSVDPRCSRLTSEGIQTKSHMSNIEAQTRQMLQDRRILQAAFSANFDYEPSQLCDDSIDFSNPVLSSANFISDSDTGSPHGQIYILSDSTAVETDTEASALETDSEADE